MASIRRVIPQGPPNTASSVAEGVPVALKIARHDDTLAAEALGREVESFVALSRAPGSPPCPRLYDIVGNPVTGIVMEWCPTDMERWWESTWSTPRSFVELCEALADVARRVREYEAVSELELGKRVIHADIKPRNVLRAADGRWLLTDFGAAKSRSVDEASWAATRMILGTENFIAPEALFNARKPHPAAMDTWSLGCTFFALLRMRTLLRGGGRLPANGTHAHLFRLQRVALIGDLQQRKPALFVDKDLDPAQFTSPDKLPEKDRKLVAEAIEGVFGASNHTLEGVLTTECLNLLDRALRIDPAQRFRDPLEMAGEFEALAQRFRELALRADTASGRLAEDAAPPVKKVEIVRNERPEVRPDGRVEVRPEPPRDDKASGDVVVRRGTSPSSGGASAPRVLVSEEIVVDEGSGKRGSGPVGAASARVPPWIGLALIAVLGLQVVQVGVSIATLAVTMRQPAVLPAAPTPGPLATATARPTPAAPALPAQPAPAPAEVLPATPAETPPTPAEPPVAAQPVASVPKRLGTPAAPVTPSASGSTTGLVLVSGAQAYLLGPAGKLPTGGVAPGSYELFAQAKPNGEFESQGTINVVAGDRIIFKCGLGTCRRSP